MECLFLSIMFPLALNCTLCGAQSEMGGVVLGGGGLARGGWGNLGGRSHV